MKEILFFNEIDRSMNAAVGGKGANLGEMTRAGMAVPTGFCLTTRVYDEFAAGLSLEGLPADEARAILQKQDLPDGCAELMKEALRGFPEGTLFSVRSSATAEDLPYASFAGQQDTYLNVTAEGLAEAVKNCFISLFTDRAVSYRRQNGITKPSMSVVVQQMVRSDASGIMFTADPVSGNRNHLVIDAVFGLGEAIVSGLVSPDHITFNKPAKQIVSCETACKEFALLPLPGGGTEKKMLHSSEPVLTEEQIQGLAALGELLEKHYEAPQDVEWAVENGKLYILQTRAITSLYPVPGPFEDGKFHFLFNLGYQQMNPEAMPVMALDGVLGATNILEEDLPDYKSIMIYGFGQHIFVDMSRIFSIKPLGKLVLRILPVADSLAASAVQEMLGRGLKFARPDRRLSKLPRRLFKALPRFARAKDPAGAAAFAVRQLRESSDAAAETLRSTPVNAEAVRTLFREIQIINGFSDPFMPMVVSSILALNKLKKTEEKLGCKGRWTETLQIGNAGNAITEMGLSLGDLADYAAADEGFRRLLEENERNLHEALMERNDEKGDAYRRFMEQYGFRGPGEIDISRPRYEENPTPIIHQILAMSDHKEPGSHRREYEEKNEKAVKAGEELIEEIRSKLGERAARKARRQLAKYQAYYPFREHFKYFWMKRYIEARRLLLRIGETMTENGQISCREDIMHLHMKEVYEALQSDADLHELVDGRRQEFERVSRLTPPRIITCEGEVLMGSVSREDIPEGALAGVGVSPGTVEGIARVVLDPNEASIAEGEILVAPFTDPGWTPLFVNAEAVVTEIGGMLTHGAVVAREYGIPGVVGVVDATKKITTGQKIRVDGTTGYVEII